MFTYYKKIFTSNYVIFLVPEGVGPVLTNKVEDANENGTTLDELIARSRENGVDETELQNILKLWEEDKSKLADVTKEEIAAEVENVKLEYAAQAILNYIETLQASDDNYEFLVTKRTKLEQLLDFKLYDELIYDLNEIKDTIGELYNEITQIKIQRPLEDAGDIVTPTEASETTTTENSRNIDIKVEAGKNTSIDVVANRDNVSITLDNQAPAEQATAEQATAEQATEKENYTVKYLSENGKTIKDLQRTLGVKNDGILGPKTLEAIKKFQAENGLKIDGDVGPETFPKIKWSQEGSTTVEREIKREDGLKESEQRLGEKGAEKENVLVTENGETATDGNGDSVKTIDYNNVEYDMDDPVSYYNHLNGTDKNPKSVKSIWDGIKGIFSSGVSK